MINRGRPRLRRVFDELKDLYAEKKKRQDLSRRAREAVSTLEVIGRRLELRSVAAKGLDEDFRQMSSMEGGEFEGFIFKICQALGYNVERTPHSGDQGVDVLGQKDGIKVAIQCKRYARPVGNRPVQEVYAGASFYNADEAWVVAPAGYTEGARVLAMRLGIKLYDRSGIQKWIERVNVADNPRVYMSDSEIYTALLDQNNWYLDRLGEAAEVLLAAGTLPGVGERFASIRSKVEDKLDILTGKMEIIEVRSPEPQFVKSTEVRVQYCATYLQMAAFLDLAASESLVVKAYSHKCTESSLPEIYTLSYGVILRPRIRVDEGYQERARELSDLALTQHADRHPVKVRVESIVETCSVDDSPE